jgi:hypothetical protein
MLPELHDLAGKGSRDEDAPEIDDLPPSRLAA